MSKKKIRRKNVKIQNYEKKSTRKLISAKTNLIKGYFQRSKVTTVDP